MKTLRVVVIVVLIAAGFTQAPDVSAAKSLSATLSGASEVPAGTGDPDGSGTATITLKKKTKKKRKLCWTVIHQGIDVPTEGHIHEGGPGTDGPVFIGLFGATTTAGVPSGGSACFKVSKRKAKDLLVDTASRFYVNLHNAAFPDGAIRGQLQQP